MPGRRPRSGSGILFGGWRKCGQSGTFRNVHVPKRPSLWYNVVAAQKIDKIFLK